MCSALKMCASLALCQPANADLNLAAGDVFLYIYIYSLQDKLRISPKIVCCDMIPNLGGPSLLTGGHWPPSPPRTAPAWYKWNNDTISTIHRTLSYLDLRR